MSAFGAGEGVALFLAAAFAGTFVLASAFAEALASLSPIRRKALVEESPGRWKRLLGPGAGRVPRIAVRLTAQGAVLGGLLSTGTALSGTDVPEPFLVAAIAVLLGWLVLEAVVLWWVGRRGAEGLLEALSLLVPAVVLLAAPLRPILSNLLAPPAGDPDGDDDPAARGAEVRALLDVAREEGILDRHDQELVSRAVDFGDRKVGEVMTPRPDTAFADADAPLGDVADVFVRTKVTRLPLVEGSVDRPVGIVHVKDVFAALRSSAPPATARPLAREVLFAPETQSVPTLLADFRRRRQHLAVVVDEWGAVTGIVTLEDLVEELVGEIADEHEGGLDPIVPLPGGAFSVAGRVRATEVAGLFGVVLPPAEYDTVGGLVSERLGRIPRAGDLASALGLAFRVEEADRRRVIRVRVEREAGKGESEPPREEEVPK